MICCSTRTRCYYKIFRTNDAFTLQEAKFCESLVENRYRKIYGGQQGTLVAWEKICKRILNVPPKSVKPARAAAKYFPEALRLIYFFKFYMFRFFKRVTERVFHSFQIFLNENLREISCIPNINGSFILQRVSFQMYCY